MDKIVTIDDNSNRLRIVDDHKNKGHHVRVQALREIHTTAGRLNKGELGFVPREWIERVLKNRGCSCNGSINWIKFI